VLPGAPEGTESAPAGPPVPGPAPEAAPADPEAAPVPEAGRANPVPEPAPEPVRAPVDPEPAPAPAPAPEAAPAHPAPEPTPAPEPVPTKPTPAAGGELPGVAPGPEQGQEPPAKQASGQRQEGSLASPVIPLAPAGAPQADEPRGEAASEVPVAVGGSLAGASSVRGQAATAGSGAGPASTGGLAGMIAAQGAGGPGCELSALERRGPGSCTGASPGAQGFMSQSMGLPDAPSSLTAETGSPAGHGHGGSAVAGPPVGPAPGPAPGGASGSSAAASGLALSGFLTLAGLLLLGAPRAMRRLRLSCEPWRTACFVLIPERPG
jgi:hypothetical protein